MHLPVVSVHLCVGGHPETCDLPVVAFGELGRACAQLPIGAEVKGSGEQIDRVRGAVFVHV
jgi:hypothetical protein